MAVNSANCFSSKVLEISNRAEQSLPEFLGTSCLPVKYVVMVPVTAPTLTLINGMVNAFLGAAKADGWAAVLYTNNDYRQNIFAAATLAAWYVWLADYSGGPDVPCAMQQTNSGGTVQGISGSVDMDICFRDFTVSALDYACDTSGTVSIARGAAYQIAVTAAAAPKVVAGTADVVTVLPRNNSGNQWFYYLVPIGKSGDQVGVYINGGPRQLTVKIK